MTSAPLQNINKTLPFHNFSSVSHETISSSLLPSCPPSHPDLGSHTLLLLRLAKSSVYEVESGIMDKTQLVVFIVGRLPPQHSHSCQIHHVFPLIAKAAPTY